MVVGRCDRLGRRLLRCAFVGLLDDGADSGLVQQQRIGRRGNLAPLLIAIVAVLFLLFTAWPSDSDGEALVPDSTPTTSTTTPPDTTTVTARPGEVLTFSDWQVSIIASAPSGGDGLVFESSMPGIGVELPFVSTVDIDQSGRWMAAMGAAEGPDSSRILYLGLVGSPLVRISAAVDGFAWHDTDPGRLSYIDRAGGPPVLATFDVTVEGDSDIWSGTFAEVAPVDSGWLQLYGEFGFTVSQSATNPWFRVLSPDGVELISEQTGAAIGYSEVFGLVAMVDEQVVQVDPDTGLITPLAQLGNTAIVWDVATGGAEGMFAVQTTNDDFSLHEVIVFDRDGEVIRRLPSAALRQAMAWSADGTTLGFTIDDFGSRTQVVLFTPGERRIELSSFPEERGRSYNHAILIEPTG